MQFVCRYGTPDGRILTQIQHGASVVSVRRELEQQGFHIFEVRQRGVPFQIKLPFSIGRKRLPLDEFMAFNQELAALLRAGLPLLQALELMLERMEETHFASVLAEIRDRIKSGEELSEAFASYGDLFPALYPSTLKAGERSGELEQVIRRFIRYLRLVIDARRRIVSALVYPAVLIGLSIAMLAVLAVYVVPSFSKFYSDLDAELPTMTQWTLTISFWLRDNISWLLVVLIIGAIALKGWSGTPGGRRFLHRLRLRIPLIGEIFHQFALSEFCRSLSTLVAGGIPLVSGLETATSAVSNAYIGESIRPSVDDVRQGQAFHAALDRTGVFPKLSIDMIKVGEATGSLDEMLNSVSDYLDERVETRVQRLLTLIEPMMLIVMGVIIALLLISIYLPMFGALGQVGT